MDKLISFIRDKDLGSVFQTLLRNIDEYFTEELSLVNPLWVSLRMRHKEPEGSSFKALENINNVYLEILKVDHNNQIQPEDLIDLTSPYINHEIEFFAETEKGKDSLFKLLTHLEKTKLLYKLQTKTSNSNQYDPSILTSNKLRRRV